MTSTATLQAQRLRDMQRELNPVHGGRIGRAEMPAASHPASQRPPRARIERGMNTQAWRDGVEALRKQKQAGVPVNVNWIPRP